MKAAHGGGTPVVRRLRDLLGTQFRVVRGDTERIVERLESFSDIVIGFALAQTALTLVIPPNPMAFYTDPAGLFGYLVTFVAIARFWWTHAETFREYFVPTRPAVIVNFMALASLGLVVFALQVWLHPGQSIESQNFVARAYFAILALAYTLLAVLRLMGVRSRYAELNGQERAIGIASAARVLCETTGTFVGVAVVPHGVNYEAAIYLGNRLAEFPLSILVGIFVGGIVGRVLASILRKRDWGSPEKA